MFGKLHFFFCSVLLFFSVLNSDAQESCSSNSSKPYEWPSQRNWFIAPNLYSGVVINMETMGVTSVGGPSSPVTSYEGVSAASNDKGELLFYTNGRSLWTGVGGSVTKTYSGLLTGNESGMNNGSAAQGVITIRHPLNPKRYWVVTTDDALGSTNGMNAFSFDTLGNLLSGPIRLGTFRTSEGVSATLHANGVDVWLTCLASGTGRFHTFLLKCNGFETESVVSSIGPNVTSGKERGGIAYSWDGEFLAQAHPNWWPDGDKIVSIYKFNKSTGQLYDAKNVSGAWGSPYDITWSPNNKRVYVSMQNNSIHYLDISSWNATNIKNSWTSTGVSSKFTAIEVGYDGFLYLSHGQAGGGFLKKMNGDLNTATSFTASNVSGTAGMSHLGLPTIYIPPSDEPDMQEVGPYCTTDPLVDLNTLWICSGNDAENPSENPLAYSGTGIIDRANGIFDPSVAGQGTHQIIFEYCSVNDTAWITVNNCTSCIVDVQDAQPKMCIGESLILDAYVINTSGTGEWSIDSFPSGISPTIINGLDTIFDASSSAVASGKYKLKYTVTNGSSSCYDSIYIIVNPVPTPDLGPDQSICGRSGFITFDAGSYDSYLWHPNSETSKTITTDVSGDYIVTVTDANNCTASDTVTLKSHPLPTSDLGPDITICQGAEAIFNIGIYSNYLWHDGSSGINYVSSSEETIWVEVIDSNGCILRDTAQVFISESLPVNLGTDSAFCEGDSIQLSSGYPEIGYTFTWSTMETNSNVIVKSSGVYDVLVEDLIGCIGRDTVIITMNSLSVIDLGSDKEICEGSTNLFNTGLGSVSTLWNTGDTTPSITVSIKGAYFVTVQNINGCESSDTVYLSVNNNPTPDLGPDITICSGSSALFTVLNYTNYTWQNGDTLDSYSSSQREIVYLSVTDSNGCVGSDTAEIIVREELIIDLGPDLDTCNLNAIYLYSDSSSFLHTYLWNTGDTVRNISVNSSGTYFVRVTDQNGCQGSDTIILSIHQPPIIELGTNQIICDGDSILLDVGLGWSGILWGDGYLGQKKSIKTAGNYSVRVVDANGCEGTDEINLTVNPIPNMTLGPDIQVCPGDEFTFSTTPSNFDSYLWHDGKGSQKFETDTPQLVSVLVTDLNGCFATDTVQFTNSSSVEVNLPPNQTICEGESYQISVPDFDIQNHKFLWNDATTNSSLQVQTAGSYSVYVTNGDGCVGFDSITIGVYSQPTPIVGNVGICENETAILGTGFFESYSWNSGQETREIDVGIEGVYTVTVEDLNGCSGSGSGRLTIHNNPIIPAPTNQIICEGGEVTLFPSLPVGTYYWKQGGETTPSIRVGSPGVYELVVTSIFGCRDSVAINVSQVLSPSIDLGPNIRICDGQTAIVGFALHKSIVTWNTGDVSDSLEISTTGLYEATIVDSNNCSGKDVVEVNVSSLPSPKASSDTLVCFEEINVLPLKVIAGLRDKIMWSTGDTNANINVNEEGSYEVIATNIDGCIGKDTVEVGVKCPSLLWLPNAFTPNDDGINDFFGPKAININNFDLYIFNRFGEMIFYSNNINNQWDGTFGGENCQIGIYVWKLHYRSEETSGRYKSREEVGTVSLLR